MAKVRGPFMSIGAEKKFATTIACRRWKGIHVMFPFVVPFNPRSPYQTFHRCEFYFRTKQWDIDKWTPIGDDCRRFAEMRKSTPFAEYIRLYLYRDVHLWLKMNEGTGTIARDSSPWKYDTQLFNVTWTAGKYLTATYYNGVNSYGLPPDHVMTVITEATIEAWVRVDTWKAGTIFYHGYKGILGLEKTTAWNFKFFIKTVPTGVIECVDSLVDRPKGVYHVVGAFKRNEKMYIMVNGEVTKEVSVPDEPLDESVAGDRCTVGAMYMPATNYFHGWIDELRVYNRKLHKAEALTHYKFEK